LHHPEPPEAYRIPHDISVVLAKDPESGTDIKRARRMVPPDPLTTDFGDFPP